MHCIHCQLSPEKGGKTGFFYETRSNDIRAGYWPARLLGNIYFPSNLVSLHVFTWLLNFTFHFSIVLVWNKIQAPQKYRSFTDSIMQRTMHA